MKVELTGFVSGLAEFQRKGGIQDDTKFYSLRVKKDVPCTEMKLDFCLFIFVGFGMGKEEEFFLDLVSLRCPFHIQVQMWRRLLNYLSSDSGKKCILEL